MLAILVCNFLNHKSQNKGSLSEQKFTQEVTKIGLGLGTHIPPALLRLEGLKKKRRGWGWLRSLLLRHSKGQKHEKQRATGFYSGGAKISIRD